MATHAIGKFKFNLSDKGLAWRMGDGSVHRLFGRKTPADDEYDDEYTENVSPDGEEGYQDDYDAQDEGYADDYDYDDRSDDGDYDDGGYDDGDGYDDGGYDDGGYDDDGYDDDGYDDGGYGDGGYGDDRGGYDDRYQDVDADDYDGGYDGGYDDEPGSLMRYVDENDWVTYLLLFLFPPLGIYLLWRRNRFEKPLRWGLTAASAIWFVVALILLLRGLFGGAGDQQVQPNITIPPAQVTATEAPDTGDIPSIDLGGGDATPDEGTGDETGDTGDVTGDTGDVEPTATPLASSANGANANNATYVWSPASGLYYHSTNTCPSIEDGVQVWQVTKEIAENSRHQSPCPDCIGGGTVTTYYARADGKYYHVNATCSNMKNAKVYTKEAAEGEGKSPCPVCILKTKSSLDEEEPTAGKPVFISSDTTDKSGIQVYATKGGTHFHVKSNCSGMQGASKGSLRDALLAGKTACPVCCPTAGNLVYCRADSKSYHSDKNCQGMKNAKQVTLAEAMVMGKQRCEVCMKNGASASSSITQNTSGKDSGKSVSLTSATGDKVKVYATQNGKYYHTNSTCSGMKDAKLFTLKAMLQAGKKACPVCAKMAETTVYASKGGKYYHSYATCSDMKNASSGTLAEALAAGLKRCPKCWDKSGKALKQSGTQSASSKTGTDNSKSDTKTDTKAQNAKTQTVQTVSSDKKSAAPSKATASNTYVYATRKGAYYHTNSSCGGMTGASRVSLKTAIKAGKKACPNCASAANRTVYSTSTGSHYHAASICVKSGLKNGTKRKLSEALMMGQTACPYCLSSKQAAQNAQSTASAVKKAVSTAANSNNTYKSGKSGVRVYASLTGKYYHTRSNCPNLSGSASRVTLETALNYGKKACPECAAAAKRTVYATRGGKYYHYSKACAGSSAKKGSLSAALAYGLDACPNCVTHRASVPEPASATYKSGTSGIKVYATAGSKYYHANSTCSGMTGATRVSLETALNYGKKACPVCLAAANFKVYAVPGESHYHYSKTHAGSGAIGGTLATARAMGLKACSVCTKLVAGADSYDNGGAQGSPVSTQDYPGLPDSGVYIDLGSANNYYHLGPKCTKAHFSGGTKVTLQYAVDWDYKACPFCNPPTSIVPDMDS